LLCFTAADGGRLDVSTSIDNGCVTTEFSDRGSCVDPEHLERMFDRF
jgi:hypothetical protein